MQPKPFISVITVVYNGKQVLESTIGSIEKQTSRNFEYIVVDGNSTDGTVELIKKHDHTVTKWISEPDNGLYDAMNKGLKMAEGNFVLFLNAGDEFFDEKTLETLEKTAENADVIYSDTLVVDPEGKEIGLLSKLTHNNAPINLTWKDMKRGMVVCHQSFMVKKEIAPLYDLDYKLSSDIDWVINCLKASNKTVFTPFIISKFRKAGLSKSHLKQAMHERYLILRKHFGFWTNLLNHTFMMLRFVVKGRKSKV